MAMMDEFKEERESVKDKPFKERLAYFWYYYKIRTCAAIFALILLIVFTVDIINNKEYAYYCTFVNSYTYNEETGFMDEFAKTTDIDLDEYAVYLDDAMRFSLDGYDQTSMAMLQKFVSMMFAGDIDNVVMEKDLYTNYAKSKTFMDLRDVLTEEQLEKYKDNFYYFDAEEWKNATEDYDEAFDPSAPVLVEDTVDRKSTEGMTDPVPVGVILDGELGEKIKNAGFYEEDTEIIFGFVTNKRADIGRQFLDWLTCNE